MTDPLTTDETVTLGSRIERARDLYGWSQEQLGKMVAKTRAAISQYEKDMIRPKPEVLDRLADVFNADPEWFTHGRGTAPKPADAPLVIPEIDLTRFTKRHLDDLRDLRAGRDWVLPAGIFDCPVTPGRLVALRAPNRCAPIFPGDRIIVDLARVSEAPGAFLVYREGFGPHLVVDHPDGVQVLGRVIAYYRAL